MENRKRFGEYVGEVAVALENVITEEDIPKFLSSPHHLLDRKSPIEVIWTDGAKGMQRILAIIEAGKSGSFV